MGSIFLKSKWNSDPDKDFTHITLHELMHTQGMGFPASKVFSVLTSEAKQICWVTV